jgi:protease-4
MSVRRLFTAAVVALAGTSLALADATTKPSATTKPTTKPVALAPATQPSTKPSASFPSPAELVARMQAERAKLEAKLQVAYFDLDSALTEKPAGFSLFGESGLTIRTLTERLRQAREDKDVRAVLITIGPGFSANLAQAQEIRDQLAQLRRAGKRTFVYADSFDTNAYLVAAGATDVCLLGGGEVFMPGIGIETMFFRGAMDKVGVQPDFVQVGEYKGAEEPYMRTEPSDELRGEMNRLVDGLFNQITETIASSRNLSTEKVRQMVDEALLSAEQAKDRGFVDHLVDKEQLRDLLKDELGDEIRIAHDYGAPEKKELDFSNPILLLSQMMKKPAPTTRPTVALVYAEGAITDGSGEGGLFGGGGIGSEDIREAMRLASRDEQVKAIVIRIDSPGGSALASEAMWQAVRRVAEDKPVIISIGSMAASGGYYLASAGDYIYADPAAIVGSIGVVGGKFVLKGVYEWVGVTTEQFSRGRNADLFSATRPWDDRQRRMVRNWMRNTYDQFTDRIMTTRRDKIRNIDEVARGRIFLARDAKELGMVDELGGLEQAIAHAAKKAELEPGSFDVSVLPPPQTLADLLAGGGGGIGAMAPRVTFQVAPDSVLHLMPQSARQLIARQIQLGQLLQDRPVVLMSPFILTTR